MRSLAVLLCLAPTLALADGQPPILLILDGKLVRALDPETGTERWTHAMRAQEIPVVDDASVYIHESDGKPAGLAAVARADGGVRWRTALKAAEILPTPTLLLVRTKNGAAALDPTSGAIRWRNAALADADPVARYGAVTVWVGATLLTGLDAASGTQRWQVRARPAGGEHDLREWFHPGYAAAAHGLVVHDQSVSPPRLRRLDPATGKARWSRALGEPGKRGLLLRDKTVVSWGDGQLRGVRLADGELAWTHRDVTVPVAERGHHLAVATRARHLHAIDLRDGTIRWKAEVGDIDGSTAWQGAISGPIVASPCTDRVAAFDLKTGVLRWKQDSGLTFHGLDGRFYLSRSGEPLRCVGADGKERWRKRFETFRGLREHD